MMSSARSFVLLVLVACILALALTPAEGVVISQLYPRSGSLRGGQLLTLSGAGFHRQETEGKTVVYIGNNECKGIEYYSSDSTYVCSTPPAPNGIEGPASVQMVIQGVGGNSFASCLAPSCSFNYKEAYTSKVVAFPSAAGAGAVLPFQASLVDASRFSEVKVLLGQTWCDLDFQAQEEWNRVYGNNTLAQARGYLTSLNSEPLWSLGGDFRCLVLEGSRAGRTNFSVNVGPPRDESEGVWLDQHGGGEANLPHTAFRVALDGSDEVYNFESVPVIESLSAAQGGEQGGSPLTIRGSGFDAECLRNKVSLSGQPCKVVSCPSGREIVCVPSAATTVPAAVPLPQAYKGTRGLFTQIWTRSVSWGSVSAMFSAAGPVSDLTLTSPGALVAPYYPYQNFFLHQSAGLFTPPFSAEYTFYLQGQDRGELWLSSDESESNLALVASFQYGPPLFYTVGTQISSPVFLDARRSYAIKLRAAKGAWQDRPASVMLKMNVASVDQTVVPLPAGYPSENTKKYHSLPTVMEIRVSTDVRRERQSIALNGIASNSGAFRLQYGTRVTDVLFYANTTASAIDSTLTAVLDEASVCSNIDVTLTRIPLETRGVINVTFNCPGAVPRAMISVVNIGLVADSSRGVAFSLRNTRVTTPSTPASGSFLLGWSADSGRILNEVNPANLDRVYAPRLQFDASATRVQQALLSIAGVRRVDVSSSGDAQDGRTWRVTFFTPSGAIPLVQGVWNTTLLGEGARLDVTYLQQGDSANHYWDPLPGEFLSKSMPASRVNLEVNGIAGVCGVRESYAVQGGTPSTDCTYAYSASLTPTITALNPTPALTAGSTLTVTGTNFATVSADNVVAFARDTAALAADFASLPKCINVVAVSATVLTCEVPELEAGDYIVQVNVAGRGINTPHALAALQFALRLDSIAPSSGSQAGGTLLQLRGSGFQARLSGAGVDVITVNGLPCALVDVTTIAVLCRAPALPVNDATPTVAKAVSVNGATQAATFTYDASLTPQINSVYPLLVSAAVTNLITLTGSGFVADQANAPVPVSAAAGASPLFDLYSVSFGDRSCTVLTLNETEVVCRLARAAPPNTHLNTNAHAPQLYVAGQGFAAVDPGLEVDIALRVHSLSASHGSLAGGLLLTITGSGFKPQRRLITDHSVSIDPEYISVKIRVYANETGEPSNTGATPFRASERVFPCAVQSYEMNSVVCRTTDTNVTAQQLGGSDGTLLALVSVSINNVQSVCGAATDEACEFSFLAEDTPSITALYPTSGLSGTTLTITGSSLNRTSPPSVYIGHQPCAVTSQSESEIECTVPVYTSATLPVYVEFADTGFAAAPQGLLRFTIGLGVTALDVTTGSVAGGATVVVTGSGFSPKRSHNAMTVNGVAAWILSASATQLTILTPAVSAAAVSTAGGVLAADVVVTTRSFFKLETFFSPDVVLDNVIGNTGLVATPTATLSAAFSYATAQTPSLTAVAPLTGVSGVALTITGTGFGASQGASSVVIGGAACAVSAWTATSITCALGSTPAGRHAVLVTVGTAGFAATSTGTPILFTSTLSVSSVAPLQGGYGGGTLLTIQGAGFGDVAEQTVVNVCNARCLVQTTSYNQLTCLTTPLVTLDRLREFGGTLIRQAVGTAYGSGAISNTVNSYAAAFDGNVETGFLGAANAMSTLRLDQGPLTSLALTRIRFYPRYQTAQQLMGAQFFASDDGTTWQELHTVSAVQEGWNVIDIIDTNTPTPAVTRSYRYFGFAAWNGAKVMEVEFQGFRVAAGATTVSQPAVDTYSCPVGVQVMALPPSNPAGSDFASTLLTLPVDQNFAYSLVATPTVISILPTFASALGGELVTITGAGFGTDAAALTVDLNDYPCAVQSVDAQGRNIVCMTSPRLEARPAPSGREIGVRVSPLSAVPAGTPTGFALLVPNPAANVSPLANTPLLAIFRYLDRWSALTTWRYQEMPVEGDFVIIPQGQSVLLDVSPPRLHFLLIQGALIFDEQDLSLDANYIYVQGGLLQVGTETRPFTHKATITLHGDRYTSIELPHLGSKCLINGPISYAMKDGVGAVPTNPLAAFAPGVDPSSLQNYYSDSWDGRGRLDLHGIPRVRVWTKVQSTALAGSNSIVTSEDVDFAPGEEVVISSHATWSQTERRIVASLGADKRTLTFTEPLSYDHVSEQHEWAGHAVDMRYEVGLLSRNIIVQGDENSHRQSYGGHIMSLRGGIMRVENVELRHMGQSFNMGRYSIHWHLAGEVHTQYVRSNSIHDSFQRACTVHGSHYATVKNNVGAFIRGHAFFVEDGNEKYNVIEGNLAVHTIRLTSMLLSDTKPASFWTASPENFWRHNVAAGCINDGYWLELPGQPPNMPSICPVHGHLGEFFNNTAHSNGVHGLRIYPVYIPYVNPCDASSGPAPQTFTNFTSFHNGDNGIFAKKNGDLHHVGAKLVENHGSELAWVKLEEATWASALIPHVRDSLFVATTDPVNRPFRDTRGGKVGLWSPQHEHFHIDGATFVNYANNGAIAGCFECAADDTLSQGGFTIRTRRLNFINSAKRVKHTKPFKEIWFDFDGTLSGQANSSVTFDRAFNHWAECTVDQTGTLDFGLTCDSSVRIRRMQFDGVNPREIDWLYMAFGQDRGLGQISDIPNGAPVGAGRTTVPFLPKEIYGWVVPMVTSHFYTATWVSRIDIRSLRVRHSDPDLVRYLSVPGQSEREFIGLTLNYTDYRENFAVVASDNTMREWKQTAVDGSVDETGVGVMGNLIGRNKTYTFLSSSRNSSLYNPAVRDPLVLNILPLQCPLAGCPLPPKPKIGNLTRWSEAASWPSGVVPLSGDVQILNTQNILYDLTGDHTFGAIAVDGALEFEDGADMSLSVDSIAVLGRMRAGSVETPRQSKLKITFRGDRAGATVRVDNSIFLGNKVLAVLGEVQLHGKVRQRTSTSLLSTLAAGQSQLTLSETADWVVGDEIVVSGTEYDSHQSEVFTIAAVTGTVLSLSAPAAFTHFAGEISTAAPTNPSGAQSVRLAASVGLLTRSIQLTSDVSTEARYGGHIVVSEIVSDSRVGSLRASFVDFNQMGQGEMEYAAVEFSYFPSTPGSVFADPTVQLNSLVGCAFSDGFNYAVTATAAPNLRLDRNVIHRVRRSGIFIDSDSAGATLTKNLVIDVRRSLDDTGLWLNPFAGIYIDAQVAAMRDNVVGGSEDLGIVFQPEPCGVTAAKVSGNSVHSCKIGVWLLSNGARGCVRAAGFTSWKAAHMALTTIDQTNSVLLSGITVADSHIGVSLNFFSGVAGTNATISDSLILGSTQASSDCAVSSECRAASASDVRAEGCNSVYGSGQRRVGLMTSQYTNRGKTCFIDGTFASGLPVCRPPTTPERLCSLPWEQRYGLPGDSAHGELIVERTTFAYFTTTDCGMRSRAISWNPTQRDFTPPIQMSGIGWGPLVDDDAKFDFAYRAGISDPECATGCDGLNQITVADRDGTALTQALAPPTAGAVSLGHTLLSRNVLLAKPGTACVENAAWGAIKCPDTTYRQFVVENMDFDRGGRKIGPLLTTRLATSENRTDVSWGPVDDHCPMRFFFGQYQSAVIPGSAYEVMFAGSNPVITQLSLKSLDPAEAVLVRFFYTQPKVLDVLIDGVLVPTDNLITPTLSSPAGASQFNPQERRITLLMRGDPDRRKHVYSIVQKPLVQVTLALAVSIESFYGPTLVENLSLLLQIDPSRVKIVSVQPGSTIVVLYVADAEPTSASPVETDAQITRLAQLSTDLTSLAARGMLTRRNVGYDVLSMNITQATVNGTEPLARGIPIGPAAVEPEPEAVSSHSFKPLLIGIIVAAAVLLIIGAVAIAVVMRSRARQATARKFLADSSSEVQTAQHDYGRRTVPIAATAAADEQAAPVRTVSVGPRSPSGMQAQASAEVELAPVVHHADDVPTVLLHPNAPGEKLSTLRELDSQERGESHSAWKHGSRSNLDQHRMGALDLPEGLYICSRAYAPKFADELELRVGDAVIVLDSSSSSEWHIGHNTRSGKRGSFPKNTVSRDERVARPAMLAAAEHSPLPHLHSSLSKPSSPSSSLLAPAGSSQSAHARVDSSLDILHAQEAGREGWTAERQATVHHAGAIKAKHSGMDRQQSRR